MFSSHGPHTMYIYNTQDGKGSYILAVVSDDDKVNKGYMILRWQANLSHRKYVESQTKRNTLDSIDIIGLFSLLMLKNKRG